MNKDQNRHKMHILQSLKKNIKKLQSPGHHSAGTTESSLTGRGRKASWVLTPHHKRNKTQRLQLSNQMVTNTDSMGSIEKNDSFAELLASNFSSFCFLHRANFLGCRAWGRANRPSGCTMMTPVKTLFRNQQHSGWGLKRQAKRKQNGWWKFFFIEMFC